MKPKTLAFSLWSFVFSLWSLSLTAQDFRPLNTVVWPESDTDSTHYTVKGYRHGMSVLTQYRHKEVEYEAGESITWGSYHTVEVMYTWMERWAKQYPDLVDFYQVGESYEGRPILQVTLTNKKTGKDTDKPAAYFEGGRHSGEVTASESALWLLHHLLENYGRDPQITKLLDTKAIYIRPENNPDGSNMYLHTAMSNRSTVRPNDNDGDGLLDEDSGEDLNGDGVLHTMRIPDLENGTMAPHPGDPTGRLMKRVPKGEGLYRTLSEGIDNDGDGDFNEDGIGGLDLHRNYPENWRPDRGMDATGRGWTQGGAGEFPLSENETRAVFTFLITHPNISVVNSMDTRVPMHLRGPSTEFSEKVMFPSDLELFNYYDTLGMEITGYPWAGDTYNTYNTRTAVSSWSGDSTKPDPLFGHGPDFGYTYFGSIWYGDELWNGGLYGDLNGDGEKDELDVLLWDDQENGGRGFKEWELFMHPTLGPVEMGGYHPKFFAQNPPPEHLEPWIRKQALFNLAMAKDLPTLEWKNFKVKKIKSYKDSTDYLVTFSFTNSSRIPTALKMADQVKIVRKDEVELILDRKLTEGENPKVKVIIPGTRDKTLYFEHLWQNNVRSGEFLVRVYSSNPIEAELKVSSTRGGVLKTKLSL